MTYRQLIEELKKLSDEQKDMDVTIFDRNRHISQVVYFGITEDSSTLEIGHPFLTF